MEWPVDTSEIRKYRMALRQFQRLVGVQLRGSCCGVTLTQCSVLLDIEEHGPQTMGQLVLRLNLEHSALSRTVDGLVSKKLVARLRDDSDRRLVWIRLTENGVSTCQEIHETGDKRCFQVFENIPPSERAAVIQNFETLIQAYLDHEASMICCRNSDDH